MGNTGAIEVIHCCGHLVMLIFLFTGSAFRPNLVKSTKTQGDASSPVKGRHLKKKIDKSCLWKDLNKLVPKKAMKLNKSYERLIKEQWILTSWQQKMMRLNKSCQREAPERPPYFFFKNVVNASRLKKGTKIDHYFVLKNIFFEDQLHWELFCNKMIQLQLLNFGLKYMLLLFSLQPKSPRKD